MRYLVLVVVYAVLFSSLAYGAPTVFLKDGTAVAGNSIWTENSKVYLSKSKEVYEFSQDDVKFDETLKYNKLGRYQVVTPEQRSTTSGAVVRKTRRVKPRSAALATVSAEKPAVKVALVPAATPTVSTPAPVASAPVVATPAPSLAVTAATPAAQEPAPSAVPPSVTDAVHMGSSFPIAFLLIVLALSLLMIVSYWIIYVRAGHAGWKSLIPFYNWYVLMEISGKPGWWLFLLFIPLVGVAIYLFAMLSLAKKFGRSELFGVGIFLLPMIFLPLLAFSDSQYQG